MDRFHVRPAVVERDGACRFVRQIVCWNRQRNRSNAGRKITAMRCPLVLLSIALLIVPLAASASGILIPGDRTAPDPNILSLEEMTIDVGIDNGMARVSLREIFTNHTLQN